MQSQNSTLPDYPCSSDATSPDCDKYFRTYFAIAREVSRLTENKDIDIKRVDDLTGFLNSHPLPEHDASVLDRTALDHSRSPRYVWFSAAEGYFIIKDLLLQLDQPILSKDLWLANTELASAIAIRTRRMVEAREWRAMDTVQGRGLRRWEGNVEEFQRMIDSKRYEPPEDGSGGDNLYYYGFSDSSGSGPKFFISTPTPSSSSISVPSFTVNSHRDDAIPSVSDFQ